MWSCPNNNQSMRNLHFRLASYHFVITTQYAVQRMQHFAVLALQLHTMEPYCGADLGRRHRHPTYPAESRSQVYQSSSTRHSDPECGQYMLLEIDMEMHKSYNHSIETN